MSILKQLNQRPIAYYPVYRALTGSTTGGLYLSQLMYWFSKKDKIFKTDKEIMDETMLTESELKTAKKVIKKLDFITVKLEGIPAKTYYLIDWDKYQASLVKFTELEESNLPSSDSDNSETNKSKSLTETTTETTTESKKNKEKKQSLQSQIESKLYDSPNVNVFAFCEWLEFKKYKAIAPITKTINFLSKYDFATQQSIVDTSIMNNYKGLFEPKQQQPYNTPKSQTLNTNVNIWDEIEKQGNDDQEFIDEFKN